MLSVMPQEGLFQRPIPMHSSSAANDQQMGGISNTGTIEGQQAMETVQESAQEHTGAASSGALGAPGGLPAKLTQNVFVHKLYNMLEDTSISHLISWSSTNDSFVITPNADFAKACSTYFKHTNISSFVRQLNMYGFHKVSDVFHNGSPESPLWEFRHREGAFRRGDLARLSAVKRRASRQALPHRNSFSTVQRVPQQALPTGPIPELVQDPVEVRLLRLENSLHDAHHWIARSQEASAALSSKCQMLTENLTRAYQYNYDIASVLLGMLGDPNQQMHRDVSGMQADMSRNLEIMRRIESGVPSEPVNPFHRPSIVQPHLETAPPMSPFQLAHDDQRRGSLFARPVFPRPVMPQRSTTETARRFEPATNGPGRMSPPLRPILLDPLEPRIPSIAEMAPQYPAHADSSHLSPPAFPRRHTFADIRPQPQAWPSSEYLQPLSQNNAQPPNGTSPYASGQSSSNWPSSPNRTPNGHQGPPPGNPAGEQQRLQDSLARYQMPAPSSNLGQPRSSHTPPAAAAGSITNLPLHNNHLDPNSAAVNGINGTAPGAPSNWTAGPPRLLFKDVFASSDPPTRRSSMAHLLNPADTAERSDEDDLGPDELRKRKRMG